MKLAQPCETLNILRGVKTKLICYDKEKYIFISGTRKDFRFFIWGVMYLKRNRKVKLQALIEKMYMTQKLTMFRPKCKRLTPYGVWEGVLFISIRQPIIVNIGDSHILPCQNPMYSVDDGEGLCLQKAPHKFDARVAK